jgi:hypothetical protein
MLVKNPQENINVWWCKMHANDPNNHMRLTIRDKTLETRHKAKDESKLTFFPPVNC